MTSIQNYLITHKNPEEASFYMGLFSSLMRQILENSREEFILLDEEIKMLKNYVELQKIRFSQSIDFQIMIDEDLDPQYHSIPPMFAQPFIENAIEHGLFKSNNADNQLIVQFNLLENDTIELLINDNGVGHAEKIKSKAHNSLATTITKERLHALKASYKKTFELKTENRTTSSGEIEGYTVHLTLPTKVILPS